MSNDKGSYSDFSAVYTFSKDSQIVGDFLEELDAATTFDVAILIQAKEIQMRFSEEFSNTVVRLGGLHSALNFQSLLGKKFRFYVLALGNIKVYGLMIFITLSFLMIFNNLTFAGTKQSGVQFVFGVNFLFGVHFVNGVQFPASFVTIRDSSETMQKKNDEFFNWIKK